MSGYTYQLTSSVRDGAEQPFLDYKLESLQLSARLAGFRFAVLFQPFDRSPRAYVSIVEWESEDALDRAGASDAMRECVARHDPYRHMATVPAHREVVELLADRSGAGTPTRAVHAAYQVRTEATGDFVAWAEQQPADGVARRLLMRVPERPSTFYELTLEGAAAAGARPPASLLSAEPAVEQAALLLTLP